MLYVQRNQRIIFCNDPWIRLKSRFTGDQVVFWGSVAAARIVNEQRRPQVGKSWGTPKNPDCSGFSTGQIELLRFDEMDFSEFVASIPVPSGKSATYAIDRFNAKAGDASK